MFWCKNCETEVSEPIWVTDCEIHEEVDGQRADKYRIPFCPCCLSELSEADRCDCGEWKEKGDDWCGECLAIRDDTVQHCINAIRVQKKLALDTEQIKDLMMTYFA